MNPTVEAEKLPPFTPIPRHWHGLLDAYETAVIHTLLFHANAAGECWPSISLIARETHLSRATVKRTLVRLRECGILTAEPRSSGTGDLTSNLYRLHIRQPVLRSAEHDQRLADGVGSQGTGVSSRRARVGSVGADPVGSHRTDGRVCGSHKEETAQPDSTPTGGTSVCVPARACEEAADAAHTHRRPPRGEEFVLEVPVELQWAQTDIRAYWAAKRGPRTAAAARHLWTNLQAIAEAGGPSAVLEQLQAGAANGWRSIDVHSWRHYTRRSRPGGAEQTLPLDERIRKSAAFLESLNLNLITEDKPLWP